MAGSLLPMLTVMETLEVPVPVVMASGAGRRRWIS